MVYIDCWHQKITIVVKEKRTKVLTGVSKKQFPGGVFQIAAVIGFDAGLVRLGAL